MLHQKLKQPKISDIVMAELEAMVLDGTFKPGDKLPPERELAKQFEVSRPSLREGLQKLEAKGILESRHGGGTYVTKDLGKSFTDPLFSLLEGHPEFKYDLLEFRHALEGLSAYYAALRGTEADRAIIRRRYEELITLHERQDPVAEARADAAFHLAIAEAAHNVVLLHTMRALFALLEASIVASFERLYTKAMVRDKIPQQHNAMLEAVLAGDAEAARRAAHEHLAFVEETLLELGREETRIERSLRRLQQIG